MKIYQPENWAQLRPDFPSEMPGQIASTRLPVWKAPAPLDRKYWEMAEAMASMEEYQSRPIFPSEMPGQMASVRLPNISTVWKLPAPRDREYREMAETMAIEVAPKDTKKILIM